MQNLIFARASTCPFFSSRICSNKADFFPELHEVVKKKSESVEDSYFVIVLFFFTHNVEQSTHNITILHTTHNAR
jgi:hypothetical protein